MNEQLRDALREIDAQCDRSETWLRDEIITDDGFAQAIGLSVVRQMRRVLDRITDAGSEP